MELHAHIDRQAADCDGPVYDYRVEVFNDAEVAEREAAQGINDFSDIHFMNRVLCNVASPYAAHQMTVKIDDEGIDVHEMTEEGFRSVQVRWCRDECDTGETRHRDIYAEMMNY